ncbi:hypothetical protein JL722_12972 [Aureococcus anophagefferens]|nr:hypothetical protein JL722_12972 [Aureococcus anophagefferens]
MSAASQGMRDATAFLLAPWRRARPLAHSGGTPLMFAAAGGHLETLRLLIDAGGDVNAGRRRWATPSVAASAARRGRANALTSEAPISAGVRSPRPMLDERSRGDADVEPHKDDVTALQVAAQGGHLACVSLLLDAGADVRAVDEEGMSAPRTPRRRTTATPPRARRGADPDDAGFVDDDAVAHNLLWDAVAAGNEAFAALLVAKGAARGAAD